MSESAQLPAILIADDSREDRELLELLLRKAGVVNPVVCADSGAAAIAMLQSACPAAGNPSGGKPAVVFLDVNMPPGDGFQVLEWIRSNRAADGLRVLMMSSSCETKHLKLAEQMKADGYLLKHPHPATIAFLIRQAMASNASGTPAV